MLKIFVVGNLGKDATVNTLPSGKTVINFSVCHTEKNKDGNEKATWVECSYFTDSKIHEFLKKGTKVAVDGRGELRTWVANGKSGASISITVSQVELCGGTQQQAAPVQQAPPPGWTWNGSQWVPPVVAPQYAQPAAPAYNPQPVTQNQMPWTAPEMPAPTDQNWGLPF